MKPIIEIQNLSKTKSSIRIINQLNISIQKGSFLTILGKSGSGKTTLTNCFINHKYYSDNIFFSKKNIKIEMLGQNASFQYDDVLSELESYMKKNKFNDKIDELIEYFNIKPLLKYSISHLSDNQKKIIFFIRSCCIQPDIIILDDFLSTMDLNIKKQIFKYLNKINHEKKTTIINITSNSEDSLYGNEIAILNNGKIIEHDLKELILKDESNFKKCDLVYPFLADLSLKLKYYNVLDKIVLDSKEMVNMIWK